MIAKSELQALGVTKHAVLEVCKPTVWSVGNQVLYGLCKKYPAHVTPAIVIAKVWLIGRSYAAAIERGASYAGDQFYETRVGPLLVGSNIDEEYSRIRHLTSTGDRNLATLMAIFVTTNRIFSEISGRKRRSFSSKYLHFHFPRLFYLYDSRAVERIRLLTPIIGKQLPECLCRSKIDREYTQFYLRCRSLMNSIHAAYGIMLTPRQLDNLLLQRKSPSNRITA